LHAGLLKASCAAAVYDDAEALQAVLVNLSWAFAMLGHLRT
jgi:hypothetical protein